MTEPAGTPQGDVNEPGRLARGAWYGVMAQAVDKCLPVVLVLYLARTFAPEEFGVYSFVIAYLALFQILCDSIDTVLVRTLSQDRGSQATALHAGLALKLIVAVGSAIVAIALVEPVSNGQISWRLMLVASLILPSALGGAYRAYFRAMLEIRWVFFMASARALLLAAGVFAAVTAGAGLMVIFATMALANLLSFVTVAVLIRRRVPLRLSFERSTWRRLATGAGPLVLNALGITLSLRIGHILLMSMRGPVDVGQMAAASRVAEAFSLLPEALMITIYPLMAGLHANNSPALLRTAARVTRYLVVVTAIPVAICASAGDEVMTLLFGAPFIEAGPTLSLLAFTALFGATGSVILNLLIAVHHETTLYRNTLVFAFANVVASLLLIGPWGQLGAAAAMLATSAASQVSLCLLPSTARYVRPLLFSALRPFAALFVGLALGRASGSSPAEATVIALAGYGVALLALGVVNREELRFVRSLVQSASGRPER